jgi:hypothetical protein
VAEVVSDEELRTTSEARSVENAEMGYKVVPKLDYN